MHKISYVTLCVDLCTLSEIMHEYCSAQCLEIATTILDLNESKQN